MRKEQVEEIRNCRGGFSKRTKWGFSQPEFGSEDSDEVLEDSARISTSVRGKRRGVRRLNGIGMLILRDLGPKISEKQVKKFMGELSYVSSISDWTDSIQIQEESLTSFNNQSWIEQKGRAETVLVEEDEVECTPPLIFRKIEGILVLPNLSGIIKWINIFEL